VVPHNEHFRLISLSQRSETGERPHARVVFRVGGDQMDAQADGDGPVDATFKAIESRINSGSELMLYSVNAITAGTEAQGEVTVRLARAGRIVNGTGADPDIIAASAKAYINALNKLYTTAERLNPQISLAP
jgi:2-isopropylmalate synthase